MVKVNDAFADGQADTGAVRPTPGGVFYLLKFFEDFALILGFDADAVVPDINLNLFGTGRQSDAYFPAIGVAKFNGI